MESDLGDICNWSSEKELFLLGSSVNKEVFYFVNSLKKICEFVPLYFIEQW